MNAQELTGQARTHIVEALVGESSLLLHEHVRMPFLALRSAAAAEGIDLAAASSFRDFSRQLKIWNGKYDGTRPLNDAAGSRIDATRLSPAERVDAILLWSALPGASRHHWGTDIDLIDRNAIAPGYQVELTQDEFAAGGPFAALAEWLEINAARFGFFRPFQGVRSGVQPEPWHFSFAPVAENARRELTPAVLRAALEAAPLLGKELVLQRLEELHQRYVDRIDPP
jgi:LAS superfamily LD-carboxypeptidase LdcB